MNGSFRCWCRRNASQVEAGTAIPAFTETETRSCNLATGRSRVCDSSEVTPDHREVEQRVRGTAKRALQSRRPALLLDVVLRVGQQRHAVQLAAVLARCAQITRRKLITRFVGHAFSAT